jgi:hypothetical protein
MVTISARNKDILKICKAIFSVFYNISQPNFAILLILITGIYLFLPKSKISLTCKLSIELIYIHNFKSFIVSRLVMASLVVKSRTVCANVDSEAAEV